MWKYFVYSSDITYIQIANYNNDEWWNIAENQIENGWPVEYGLGFHSAVIDGYRISDTSKMVHINFGWNGNYNGYFSMDNIVLSNKVDFRGYQSYNDN